MTKERDCEEPGAELDQRVRGRSGTWPPEHGADVSEPVQELERRAFGDRDPPLLLASTR